MENRWSFNSLDKASIKDTTFKWFRKEFVEAFISMSENISILPGREENCKIPADNIKKLLSVKTI